MPPFRHPPVTVRLLLALALCGITATAWAQSGGVERRIQVVLPPGQVVDGDTFEADLDGDGRLAFPRERVRLLYVDTPEIYDSGRGVDLAHGLPAKAALEAAFQAGALELRIRADEAVGTYGRTLGELFADGRSVNLALVRQGHSALITRYALPPNLAEYEAAEAQAFSARRGIWADAATRGAALARMARDGRSVRSADNPRYHAAQLDVGAFDPLALDGHFLRLRGRLLQRRALSKGVIQMQLGAPDAGPAPMAPLQMVVFRSTAERERVQTWPIGEPLRVEGLLHRYRGRAELVLYRRVPEAE